MPVELNQEAEITLAPNQFRQVEVRVRIPETDPGESDRGWLKLIQQQDSNLSQPLEYSAVFTTFVGREIPLDERLTLVWEYWNGNNWNSLTLQRDDSENFTRPGLIRFLAPGDFTLMEESAYQFGLSPRYWLRVQWQDGNYFLEPRLQRMVFNTIMAAQTITIRNEILGSSNGNANQSFRATRAPILDQQEMEVRELEMPSAQERERIEQEEGQDAISTVLDETGRPQQIWVRWHEVPDFYGSGTRDRHYVLNHLTGVIQFGDGRNGLIPPLDTGNIRLAYYQTGGGNRGNQAPGTIVQLKTTVPYIEAVTNLEPATGGAESETLESLRDRLPRTIRHRDRAVTLENCEDLAQQASPEVARAKCFPLLNLQENPLAVQNPVSQIPQAPGTISVIIVPRSQDARPLPSLELIDRVQRYLEARLVPTASLYVVGPLYVEVRVEVEIGLTSLEGVSVVEQTVKTTLASFLHPLTGGLDGNGWDFGREPYKSDFYALLEAIPNVDYIRSLKVDDGSNESPVIQAIKDTGRFLVYSGNHKINLFFEES